MIGEVGLTEAGTVQLARLPVIQLKSERWSGPLAFGQLPDAGLAKLNQTALPSRAA
jgi:hypothetical protein